MKLRVKFLIVYSIILSILGFVMIYSVLSMISYESGSKEINFWNFISLTSICLFILIIPIAALIDKKYVMKISNTNNNDNYKSKYPLEKLDYLILFLVISGTIIDGVTIIGFSYLAIFIPFEKLERIVILNISFLLIIQIIFYIGLGMILIGFISSLINDFKKDKKLKRK